MNPTSPQSGKSLPLLMMLLLSLEAWPPSGKPSI